MKYIEEKMREFLYNRAGDAKKEIWAEIDRRYETKIAKIDPEKRIYSYIILNSLANLTRLMEDAPVVPFDELLERAEELRLI